MSKMWKDKLTEAIISGKAFVLIRKPNDTDFQLFVDDGFGRNKVRFHRFDSQSEVVISDSKPTLIPSKEFDFQSQLKLKKLKQSISLNQSDYLNLIQKTIDFLKQSSVEKIVMSRVKCVPNQGFDLFQSFKKLAEIHPTAWVYLWHRPGEETWLGATPELLLKQEGSQVETVSLAGTKSPENEWTQKEIIEQQIVTDYIAENFSGVKNLQISGPETVQAGKFHHLKSYISGEISSDFDLNSILQKIHPTPAVCGMPKQDSFDFIIENEGYDREFYTGFIGLETAKSKEYYVNLRCAQIFADQVALYVGGGILTDSVPEKEWEETELKSTTILNGLC